MQLGWIDFSKEDREKVLDVINLFQEEGAVDELGIGTIRDAFANYFFPGTSTVQTRAKYLLIVPYILKEASEGVYGNNYSQIMKQIDVEEKNCGLLFMQNCPDEDGIIGKRVLPKGWVSRKPSNIYWNGIRTLGIIGDKSLSIQDYVSLSCYFHSQKVSNVSLGNRNDENSDLESDDEDAGDRVLLPHFNLPDTYKTDWRDGLVISLNEDEATFLRKQIIQSIPNTLFAYLLKNDVDVERYVGFEPLFEELKTNVPDKLKEMMSLACDFNRLVYLARIRYNLILSDFRNQEALSEWEFYKQSLEYMASVNLNEIYEKLLITNWNLKKFLGLLKEAFLSGDIDAADDWIKKREVDLKGSNRAKLNHVGDYDPQSWVGGRWLDYRFANAKRIIKDIYEGEVGVDV